MQRRAIRSDREEPIVSAIHPAVQARATSKPAGIPGIKHVVAVASGKGGVGKSTTSCNLALGFAALGLKVGILDAEIYGPSLVRASLLRWDHRARRFSGPVIVVSSVRFAM